MFRSAIAFLLLRSFFSLSSAAPDSPPPNIIVIFADDLGYGDLGCFGSTSIATPRLDRMAAEGIRFTDAYAGAPFCSPSRAALLTGRLPARCGLPYVLFPAEHTGLPPEEITLAELLHERGYATACVGKWHLGWDTPFRPLRQGFDEFYGLPYANDSALWQVGEPFKQVLGLEPLPLIDGDRVSEAPVDQSTLTRRYTERAAAFIRAHKDRPFFLYLAHTMPHAPVAASAAFAGKSRGGPYGDAVEELDWSTGVVLDTLRELGLAERTLVIFTSDNGQPPGPAVRSASFSSSVKGKAKAKAKAPAPVLRGSNGPLRGGKGQTFEGGVRVPTIAWWPGHVAQASSLQRDGRQDARATLPARVIHEPVSLMDLFPTAARLAGADLPADRVYDGRDVSEIVAQASSLQYESRQDACATYYYFGPQLQAVRLGQWKLFVPIDHYPDARALSLWFTHQPELFERQHRLWPAPTLYDLAADPGETADVAAAHPDVVERLTRLAREFDEKLQRDRRPMQFIPGPKPPAPAQVRRPEDDLSIWQTPSRP